MPIIIEIQLTPFICLLKTSGNFRPVAIVQSARTSVGQPESCHTYGSLAFSQSL